MTFSSVNHNFASELSSSTNVKVGLDCDLEASHFISCYDVFIISKSNSFAFISLVLYSLQIDHTTCPTCINEIKRKTFLLQQLSGADPDN